MPCAVCQFHLRTAPETWLACGACSPGLLDNLNAYTAATPATPAGSAGADIDNTGPMMTLELMEQELHMSQPCRARCNATIEPAR